MYVSVIRQVFAHDIYLCVALDLFVLCLTFYTLSSTCPVYVSPVGKPAVMHLRRVSALSDHLLAKLSHSRLTVLITACFSLSPHLACLNKTVSILKASRFNHAVTPHKFMAAGGRCQQSLNGGEDFQSSR